MLEKFEQQHEGDAFVAPGKVEDFAVGGRDFSVVPERLVEPGALGVDHQFPAEMIGEKAGEFVAVAAEETEGVGVVLLVKIGAFKQDVQDGLDAVAVAFEQVVHGARALEFGVHMRFLTYNGFFSFA